MHARDKIAEQVRAGTNYKVVVSDIKSRLTDR